MSHTNPAIDGGPLWLSTWSMHTHGRLIRPAYLTLDALQSSAVIEQFMVAYFVDTSSPRVSPFLWDRSECMIKADDFTSAPDSRTLTDLNRGIFRLFIFTCSSKRLCAQHVCSVNKGLGD